MLSKCARIVGCSAGTQGGGAVGPAWGLWSLEDANTSAGAGGGALIHQGGSTALIDGGRRTLIDRCAVAGLFDGGGVLAIDSGGVARCTLAATTVSRCSCGRDGGGLYTLRGHDY